MATSPSKRQSANLEPARHHHRTPSAIEAEKELAFGQVWSEAGGNIDRPERPTLDGGRRKSSVAFSTAGAEETIEREASRGEAAKPIPRRISSPPPPPTYHRGISFDTFDNKDASTESFTLQYKHTDYRHSSRSRTFLCGTDTKDYSEYALEWMIDELVDDGDDIICLRVVDKESKIASEYSVEKGKYREEAQMLLDSVVKKNTVEQKAISVVLELAIGRVQDVIQRMIQLYEPAALVVGTRGRNLGGMQGLLPGSVSKYCLQHSPVPVVVVRPSAKRIKKKQKRLQETGRSLYSNMLEQSKSRGRLSLYDKSLLDSSNSPLATKKESEAVAKAIGPPRGILRNPQHGGVVGASTYNPTDDNAPAMPSFALPIGFLTTEAAPRADLAMKSPIIAMLGTETWDDSPTGSGRGTPNPPRGRSPAPPIIVDPGTTTTGEIDPNAATASTDNPVFDDEVGDEESLGVGKLLDHRRPSTRETTPWLNSILRQPERPERRPPSRNRNGRSRSR